MHAPPADARQSDAPLTHRRVLVVDDDDGIRAFYVSLLAGEGFEVTEAKDGREGAALAIADPPDLIICDVNMPILDGFGLALILRENRRTKNVPLIFVTGEADPEIARRATDVGAAALFPKPFLAPVLSSFVRDLLGGLTPAPVGGHAA